MSKHRTLKRSRPRGQGMTEYIIIVALVGIAAIGVTTVFGENVRHVAGAAAAALEGDTGATSRALRGKGQREASKVKTLADFSRN